MYIFNMKVFCLAFLVKDVQIQRQELKVDMIYVSGGGDCAVLLEETVLAYVCCVVSRVDW